MDTGRGVAGWLLNHGFIPADANGIQRTPHELANQDEEDGGKVGVLWRDPKLPTTRRFFFFHQESPPIFLAVITLFDFRVWYIRPMTPDRMDLIQELIEGLQAKLKRRASIAKIFLDLDPDEDSRQ